jgi:predicted P-loop ATPase/GTPase
MATYYGDAYFYDSTKNDIIKLNPVECDVILEKVKKIGKDSSTYIFSFAFGNLYYKTIKPIECVGIRSYNNICYPIFNHIRMDYENNSDSTKFYMNKNDSDFKTFLKNYKGRMSSWLKQETIKRRIFL